MRFSRRFLPLPFFALLLAGAFSLNALALSADSFSDAENISYWQAVATLTQLNVIDGKEDGSFDPGGPVTRAEAAKLLTLMVDKGNLYDYGTKGDNASFSDIRGHWAETQIEYCCSRGIVAGRSGGIFDPEGTVTVSEFAKMALTILGYESHMFSLVGEDWEVNTNICADRAGLYEGLEDFDPSGPIRREMAAQVLYNALNAHIIEPVITDMGDSETPPTFEFSSKLDAAGQPVPFWANAFPLTELPSIPDQPKK